MPSQFIEIKVHGKPELQAAFQLYSKEARNGIQAALAEEAGRLTARAQANAAAQGLTPPGQSGRSEGGLVGGIRGGVRVLSLFVRDDRARDGFPYPALYEFGRGARGDLRPFMGPAVKETYPSFRANLVAALDIAATTSRLG